MARRGERVERSSGAAPPRQSGGSDLLEIEIRRASPGVPVISLAGELDLSTAPTAERRLIEELDSSRAVVVDLSRLNFIDSTGIGLLIQAHRSHEPELRLHTVVAPGSQVERVFRLAGIDRALRLHASRESALAGANESADS